MIFGLEPRDPWPDGWTPLEAMAVVKALDADGDVGLVLATTDGLSCWEAAGMLRGAAKRQEKALDAMFRNDDPDEGDAA